jgi:ketosteroid isomerase-like protein
MVNTKYHLRIFYNKDGMPLQAEYVKNADIDVVTRALEQTDADGEYYCEYDNIGVFIYTENGKIVKSRTFIQDCRIKSILPQYKPKKTISYTEV